MNSTTLPNTAADIIPIATINGEVFATIPKDLYIPPDAMRVLLEEFEGPLDLLLYLIRKQQLDILNIPIAKVTEQYMQYIELMQELSFELAAEYLVMAAMLAEIKSRLLLPRISEAEGEEEDPRLQLVRRLQEYERFREVAGFIDELPRQERDIFEVNVDATSITVAKPLPTVALPDLLHALIATFERAELHAHHQIHTELLSMQEKMTDILDRLQQNKYLPFLNIINVAEGRLGIVVTFMAMLELLKQHMIDFVQASPFAPIYLTSKADKK